VIPRDYITEWRAQAPWVQDAQVEQDLVISRALVAIFSHPLLQEALAFRGGTALYKLHLKPAARYSEDIDLVQRTAGPIGPLVDEIRAALDPWLGKPKWRAGQGRFTLHYSFDTTFTPIVPMRVKIEINTREHFAVHGCTMQRVEVANPWFSGHADVATFSLPELLGTKLRALYQRKKGRDLFDLDLALDHPAFDGDRLLEAFERYIAFSGTPVTRAQFEANMAAKLTDPAFLTDVTPLLRTSLGHDAAAAWARVHAALVSRLPGDPWKGDGEYGAMNTVPGNFF
jgi:predicted nucleotidyltransferase component of viral defense system